MEWKKFKDQFDESWHERIAPFIESKECDEIYAQLKADGKRGKRIAPLSNLTFRCFKETKREDLKAVLVGMCPYHTMVNYVYVADGLLMGCSVTGKLQPSLENFYNGIEKELHQGLAFDWIKNPDVSYLAHQGVLMFNAALTTEIGKAGSHNQIWAPFTKYVIETVLEGTNAPILFLGKDAAAFKRYTPPFTWSFAISHPASAAYNNSEWDTEGAFTKINNVIKDNKKGTVSWLDDLPF